jgi:hypothetical protein
MSWSLAVWNEENNEKITEFQKEVPTTWVDVDQSLVFWPPGRVPSIKKQATMVPDDSWLQFKLLKVKATGTCTVLLDD